MKGQQVGYMRVSSADQNLDRQLVGIELDRVFQEKASAKNADGRPVLAELMAYVRQGDTLHVHSIDRLARNLADLESIVGALTAKGVAVRFHKENLAFTGDDNPMSRLLLQIVGAFAQFERSMIRERQREGIQAAKAAGKPLGRPRGLTEGQVADIRRRVAEGASKADLAREFGVSRQTLYSALG